MTTVTQIGPRGNPESNSSSVSERSSVDPIIPSTNEVVAPNGQTPEDGGYVGLLHPPVAITVSVEVAKDTLRVVWKASIPFTLKPQMYFLWSVSVLSIVSLLALGLWGLYLRK